MNKQLLATALCFTACSGVIRSNGEGGGANPGGGNSGTDPGETGGGSATGAGANSVATTTPGTGGSMNATPACTTRAPLPVPTVRRLTRREYNNTVRDLLGDTSAPAKGFVVDDHPDLFDNNASAPVSVLSASQYADAADALARTAVAARLTTLAPCAAPDPGDGCVGDFIKAFGKRAYRRPLTVAEANRLTGLYRIARQDQGADYGDGVRVVLTAMLQSPSFINHIERGQPAASEDPSGAVALTPYEVASRLSYFLWNTMPDATLLTAADANRLGTAADVAPHATRMLADPRARDAVLSFFQQWLALDKLDQVNRDTKLFPQWNPNLRTAMRGETEAFLNHVTWQGDGRLSTLMTAPFSFLTAGLGGLYQVPGVTGDIPVKTDLDPTQRAGLLTQGSLLAMTAHFDQTSPVHRGLMVRKSFLCQTVPPPPPNVNVAVPQPDPNLTTRARFDQHRTDPYCASCHRLLDPVGLGFENYDAIGRYRTTENGLPVDASGELESTLDLDGKFNGAVELATRLARSPEAHACMVSSWIAYGTGAGALDALDATACTAAGLAADFSAGGTDIKKLIVSVAASDVFLRRPATTVQMQTQTGACQ